MKIEKEWAFNAEEYVKSVDGTVIDKDKFNIVYEYVNKVGEDVSINIAVKLLEVDKQPHIVKKGALDTADGKAFFACVVFDNPVEYKEFVAPEWLEQLEEAL